LKELEENIDTQATFACEKIKDNCPFIKIINKKTFDQLEQQKKTFQEQYQQIETTIKKLQTEFKILNDTPLQKENKSIEVLETQQKEAEKAIEQIK